MLQPIPARLAYPPRLPIFSRCRRNHFAEKARLLSLARRRPPSVRPLQNIQRVSKDLKKSASARRRGTAIPRALALSTGVIFGFCSLLGCDLDTYDARQMFEAKSPADRFPSDPVHFASASVEPVSPESNDFEAYALDSDSAKWTERRAPNPVPPKRTSHSRFDPNDPRPPLLYVETNDSTLAGVPIGLFADQTFLMGSDGKIRFLENANIRRQAVLQERFQPMDRNDLAMELRAEFGKQYTVKQESPYLIVSQPYQAVAWAKRFRSIVHSFRLYCTTHGIETRPIEFPLTAIIFGTHAEFLRYAHQESANLPPNCVGYYSQKSNRIVLFESPTGDNSETIATICHEATHQLAFNSGLHQRLASTPLWLVEGFATMFESPGLAGLTTKEGGSRWPDSRKRDWLALAKNPSSISQLLDSLIRNDTKFESNPMESYCVSWAMVAYLSQRRSREFTEYLQFNAKMPPYQEYSASDRLRDFRTLFGNDPKLITKSLIQFIDGLQ
jgi:hypothetical protein